MLANQKRASQPCTTTAIELQYMEEKYWRTKALLENKQTPVETPYVTSSMDHSVDEIIETVPRVYLERDYSEVLHPRFTVEMPQELDEMRVDPAVFARTMKEINLILDDACAKCTRRTAFETITSVITCYIANIYRKTHYERCLERLREYIEYQNITEYHRRGLRIEDPTVDGMRHLKFVILDQRELIATFSEGMLGQRPMPPAPVESRKKSDTKKLLTRVATHLDAVTVMHSNPRPGTSASFGIPPIRPKNEPPPGRNASYGIHSMHYVVPVESQHNQETLGVTVTTEQAKKAVLQQQQGRDSSKPQRSRRIIMPPTESELTLGPSQYDLALSQPQSGSILVLQQEPISDTRAPVPVDNATATAHGYYPARYRRSRHILPSVTESQAVEPSRVQPSLSAEAMPQRLSRTTTAEDEDAIPTPDAVSQSQPLNPNHVLRDYLANQRKFVKRP